MLQSLKSSDFRLFPVLDPSDEVTTTRSREALLRSLTVGQELLEGAGAIHVHGGGFVVLV